jgi:YD repeat-containing protein
MLNKYFFECIVSRASACNAYRHLLLCLGMLSFELSVGQDLSPSIATPTAYSFLKFTETPVDLYSGLPDVTIPLYTVRDGSITLPIALRNHASGIKVEEQSSWVGLAWNLNVGGVITHTANGRYDLFGTTSSPRPADYLPLFGDVPPSTYGLEYFGQPSTKAPNEFETYANGRDGWYAPDIYSFNFAGYSGKFIIDMNDRSIRLVEKNANLAISHYPETNPVLHAQLNGWQIIDPNGIIYRFEEVENVDNVNDAGIPVSVNYYMTKIIYTDGSVVNFEYSHETNIAYNLFPYSANLNYLEYDVNRPDDNYTSPFLQFSMVENESFANRGRYQPHVLKKITMPNTVIDFYRSSRLDIQNEFKLDRIKISDKADVNVFREIKFYYSYFESSVLGESLYTGQTADELSKRLKLDSVSALGDPVYAFQYYEDYLLPKKSSASRDHWGYSNGKDNDGLIPNLSFFKNSELQRMAGAVSIPDWLKKKRSNDRGADPAYMKSATIKRIIYPTGGSTTFDFESNSFSNFQIPEAGYSQVIESYNIESSRNGAATSPGTPVIFTPETVAGSTHFTLNVLITAEKGYVPTHLNPPTPADIKTARFNSLDNAAVYLIKYVKATGSFIGVEKTWTFADENFYYGFDGIPGSTTLKIEDEVILSRDYKYGLSVGLSYAYPTSDTYANAMHLDAKLYNTVYAPFDGTKSIGGGLRIKQITHDPGLGNPVVKEFEYESGGVSYGKLPLPPNYLEKRRLYAPFGGCNFQLVGINPPNLYNYDPDTHQYTPIIIEARKFCEWRDADHDGFDDASGQPLEEIPGCAENPDCFPFCQPIPFYLWTLVGTSNISSTFSGHGGNVGYDRVIEYNGPKASHEGYTVHYFRNTELNFAYKRVPTVPKLDNGLLEKREIFNQAGTIVASEQHEYEVDQAPPYWGIYVYDDYVGPLNLQCARGIYMDNFDNRFSATYYNIKSEQWRRKSSVFKSFAAQTLITSEQLTYNTRGQCTQTTRYLGDFQTVPFQEFERSTSQYPHDLAGTVSIAAAMVAANFLEVELRKGMFRGATQIKRLEFDFNQESISYSGGSRLSFYPSVIRDYNQDMMTFRQTNATFEKGRIIELTKPDGVVQSFVWDYSKGTLQVKAINIPRTTLLSNYTTCSGSESCLRSAVGGKVQLTFYTHKTLHGITHVSDVNGIITQYTYDNQGRLKYIRDHHDDLVQYFNYHFITK